MSKDEKDLTKSEKLSIFPDTSICVAYRGSVAHNMYIPNTDPNSVDDIDLIGIYMAPKEYYIGLGFNQKTYSGAIEKWVGKYDTVAYEFRKFVGMLLKSNPNVLSLLWLRENHYIKVEDSFQQLINNRNLFSSKKIYKSFSDYAYGMLKKMTHNSKEGYMGAKRKALVDKFGFDPSNASHCIRLLQMGMEFLTTGELNVFRDDAPKLIEIKLGNWTLEQVKTEADRLFHLTDIAFINSKLPDHPDYDKIERLVMDIMYEYLRR